MTTTIHGALPCGHHGCNRAVAADESYCWEHKPPAPRVVFHNFQPRNLDDELRAAQIRRARAKADLAAAEKHLEETEAAVANWDRTHAND